MIMALALFHQNASLTLVAAYENGLAAVASMAEDGSWTETYRARPHSQPILSLDLPPSKEYFFTSSADAILVKHPVPFSSLPVKVRDPPPPPAVDDDRNDGRLRRARSSAIAIDSMEGPSPAAQVVTQPLKIVNTKHAGQQSLKVRSDGKVFATAGWDSRVRVYSAKTMKEVAVLKWHTVGCYAVAFSPVHSETAPTAASNQAAPLSQVLTTDSSISLLETTVKERRMKYAETAHWLVAGSKDGKVSLWDVF